MINHFTFFVLSMVLVLSVLHSQEPEDISIQIEGMIRDSEVPALTAAAVLDGKIVSLGTAGVRKKGEAVPVTINDKFHIGSCTKSMTATLGAMFIEEGKLKWNTKISEVLPAMKIHDGYRDATFEQLVTNTAGVPGQIGPGLWSALWKRKGSPRDQRLQLAEGILSHPPSYKPGTDQVYSNAGFAIAGAMLEVIMDKPYEELLSERLFKPLQMTSAGFRAPATLGKVDQPYGHTNSFLMVRPVDPEPKGDNPPAIAPAGAVHCSVTDLAKYATFHLGQTGDGILSKESLARLHKPIEGRDYGRGWGVTTRNWAKGKALTHTGTNTMFYSVIWIAPERDFAAVAMCNIGGKEGFAKCDEAVGYLVVKHLK